MAQDTEYPMCLSCEMGRQPVKLKRQWVHQLKTMVYDRETGVPTKGMTLIACPIRNIKSTL